MTRIFVTGTDTGVGKTMAACALTRALIEHQITGSAQAVSAIKPVASEAQLTDNGLRNLDGVLLQACQESGLSYEVINPICYEPPIAPHIAAMKQGEHIDIERVNQATQPAKDFYQAQVEQQPIQLIEGAGGFLVPLNPAQSYADWVVEQQLSVIMVVQIKLGCINHSLLTYEAIKARNLHFAGWIANAVDTDRPAVYENIQTLADHLGEPLGQLPIMSEVTDLSYQLGSIESAMQVAEQTPEQIRKLFDPMAHYFEPELLAQLVAK